MPRSETKRTGGFFRGMLVGLRSSVSQPVKVETTEIEESLRPEHFNVAKTVRHGFPYQPTALGFDPVQRLLAIGTKSGSIRIFGRPGVDCHVQHVLDSAVLQIIFLINEGAMVSVCADDSLHLWNLRQKIPEIVHSLKFQRERITFSHLPFQSKWLYVGTERGNVHVVNIESFILSGYVINWNKAIELARKTHPGPVVHLSDNPADANKMLIGFESGMAVLWDLRNRAADYRFHMSEPLRSISWHHEGRQFICSHSDGSLSTWNVRGPDKPVSVMYPHAKTPSEGKPEPCKDIFKVEWKTVRGGDSFVIFSGGLPFDKAGKTPSLTVIHGKTTTVLEMEHNIIDFMTLCETPWQSDFQEPYAIVVLLYNDLVVVDLTSPGYPCFQNPYPMDLHESPVTFCTYLADCPTDLIPAFYSVGCKGNKRTGFSEKEWPVNGGEWGTSTVSYPEIVITGHADGSLKFWDSSSITLQVLYKLKTAKVFERPKAKSMDGQDEDPFAIEQIAFCPDSRILCIAGASSHIIVFRFNKQDSLLEIPVLEVPIIYDINDDIMSPESEYPTCPPSGSQQGSFSNTSDESSKKASLEHYFPLKVKSSSQKRLSGFQAELVCLTPWINGEPPGRITAMALNSSYGLLAYGNESGLAIIDIIQKTCILNMGTPDLYGSADPYQRIPRSPKKNMSTLSDDQDKFRSPSSEQLPETNDNIPHKPEIAPQNDESPPVPDAENGSTIFALMPKPPPRTKRKQNKVHSEVDKTVKSDVNVGNQEGAATVPPENEIKTPVPSTPAAEENHDPPPRVEGGKEEKGEPFDPDVELAEEACDSLDMAHLECDIDKPFDSVDGQRRFSWFKLGLRKTKSCAAAEAVSKEAPCTEHRKRVEERKRKSVVIDLRDESDVVPASPVVKMMNKLDSSFSRSRSSSMSSIDNISSEAIQCLTFADSFARKTDTTTGSNLWVGTSLGSVLIISLTIPSSTDLRLDQPVMATPSGSIFRLKGAILLVSFIDYNGSLIPSLTETWKDATKDTRDRDRDERRLSTVPSARGVSAGGMPKNKVSPTSSSSEMRDSQFVIFASEKHARVLALPSQTCIFKIGLTETSIIIRAEVVSFKGPSDSVCLVCYVANGNIAVYSLPSLKTLLEVDFLPLVDIRIARTICFSNNGHGIYLCSPSELQKFTISSSFCLNLQEMLGTLFLTKDMPEPPKQSFLKGLFGGGPSSLDREELFGEASGKPSKSLARHIPGNSNVEHVKAQTGSVMAEVARVRQGLSERGENLSQLEDRSARMMNEAEHFSTATHQLMLKYKDKKWYQF